MEYGMERKYVPLLTNKLVMLNRIHVRSSVTKFIMYNVSLGP